MGENEKKKEREKRNKMGESGWRGEECGGVSVVDGNELFSNRHLMFFKNLDALSRRTLIIGRAFEFKPANQSAASQYPSTTTIFYVVGRPFHTHECRQQNQFYV